MVIFHKGENFMKIILSICCIIIISTNNQTFTSTKHVSRSAAINASEKLLGKNATQKMLEHISTGQRYAKKSKDWWNWYWRSITNPTPRELQQHGLWYGIKSGSIESQRGRGIPSPFNDQPSIHDIYTSSPYFSTHLLKYTPAYANHPSSYIPPLEETPKPSAKSNRQEQAREEQALLEHHQTEQLSDEQIQKLEEQLKALEGKHSFRSYR